jgi:hypothetical protein
MRLYYILLKSMESLTTICSPAINKILIFGRGLGADPIHLYPTLNQFDFCMKHLSSSAQTVLCSPKRFCS